jgi:glycosyltransferase involved in cell wall biosynthesis
MACIHPYSSTFQVGSQHLARQFINHNYDVGYISAPISPFHMLKKFDAELIKRLKIYLQGGDYRFGRRLWHYVPFSLFTPVKKPILQSKYVLWHWKNVSFPNLKKKLVRIGYDDVDIFYFDNLLAYPVMADINCKKSIVRIMDNHLGFPGYPDVSKDMSQKIRESVDIVVYSAKTLEAYANTFAGKTTAVHLPNGIDFNAFISENKEIPEAIEQIKKPIAVYVGALESWFDSELLAYVAEKLSDISFLIIGPHDNRLSHLKRLKNIYLIGTVEHNQLHQYLQHCHVGIIPFNVDRYPQLINKVNPLKLYEYMACGLPVVATEWEELKMLDSPAQLCNSKDNFVEKVACFARKEVDKNQYISFAKQNDWSNNFKALLSLI